MVFAEMSTAADPGRVVLVVVVVGAPGKLAGSDGSVPWSIS